MTRRAWLAFAAMSVIWGVPYLLIKIAVDGGVPAPMLAWGRIALASAVLLALAQRARTLGALRGRWRWLTAYAVAEVSIPFPLIAAGETHVASSLAAIVIASVPLIGAVLAFRFDPSERPTPVRALGLLIGFGGVIALVGIDVAGQPAELLGTAAILLAAVGYAIGPMLIKHRLAGLDPRAMMGGSLAVASVLLAPIAAADYPRRLPSAGAVAAVVALGLVCTALAFVIFAVLIREAGTSRATVITYVNPVVAVALGVALLGERPGAGAVAGLLLILAGSWLSTGGRLPPRLRRLDAAGRDGARRARKRSATALIAGGVVVGALAIVLVAPVSATAAVPSWTTYRHDAQRSGIDPDSTVAAAPSRLWQTAAPLDGDVYGQPLVYGSRVYVATENDSVYALDAATGAIVWAHHLATAVPAGELPCGDIDPTVGITGTPVIDPVTDRIDAVADTWDGRNKSSIQHLLFALDLADGTPAFSPPLPVDPPGSDHTAVLQRTALGLDGERVVFGYGGNSGDCGAYHGWVVAAPASGSGASLTYEVEPGGARGAVWGSGSGLVIDGAGDVWAETGNGSGVSWDGQEAVLRLSPDLTLLDHWAPSNWHDLDVGDADLGSSEPLLLPGNLVFAIGKAGVGYLLSASQLGGTGAPPLYQEQVCAGSYGGAVYAQGIIYVACADGLRALSVDTQAATFAPLPGWSTDGAVNGPPILAAGHVWAIGWTAGQLYEIDGQTGAATFTDAIGSPDHFASPGAGGGRLFVAAGTRVIAYTFATTAPAATAPPATAPSATPLPMTIGVPSRVTRLRVSLRHRRVTFRLSGAADVTIIVTRPVRGRIVHARCRTRARRGRRCTIAIRSVKLVLHGHAGANRVTLPYARLARGRYVLSVTTTGPGNRIFSRRIARFAIKHRSGR